MLCSTAVCFSYAVKIWFVLFLFYMDVFMNFNYKLGSKCTQHFSLVSEIPDMKSDPFALQKWVNG